VYYYISGELIIAEPNTAVVEAAGVGYQLTISGYTLGKLAGKVGSKVKLFTHLSVREDAMELFGFFTMAELSSFRMLISVSGVGAKSAIAILSLMSPERFAAAVMNGDAKAIAKAQGIGNKTAARVILELKDKIKGTVSSEAGGVFGGEDILPVAENNISEATNALMVLGYTRAEAAYALKGADPKADLESLIKTALAKLMK
jgi:Holliday junction DNA helicase RuvA